MSDTKVPAAEVNTDDFVERKSYEFAFHVLPTVAEGEVPGVVQTIKKHITNVGGEILSEEHPERIDLVYPIVKHMEGKNRKFTSAYFGWIRFKLEADKLEALMEELTSIGALLRSLTIKLTREEEAHTFRFHENRKAVKMVEVIDEAEMSGEVPTEEEEKVEVSEEALDESLEKIVKDDEEVK